MLSLKNDLYKIAKIRLKNDDDVYEVIQETMIIAFKSIKKLKNVESFRTWVMKVLVSQINYMYRKKKGNIISFDEIENYKISDTYNLEDIDMMFDFGLICKKLMYTDNLIITLYYMWRFTDKEIGEILDLKENTVKTKRTRAKQEIKDILGRRENIYG